MRSHCVLSECLWPSCHAYPVAASNSVITQTYSESANLKSATAPGLKNSGLLQKKAFGSVHAEKAGDVAQKGLFERWRFFFFYKPGKANSSWLTAAFCTVCAACILNTWVYILFFHFRVYFCFCLGRSFSIPFFILVH